MPAAGRDGQRVKMVESMKCDTRGEGRRGTAKSTFRWPRTALPARRPRSARRRQRGANNRRSVGRGEAWYSEIYGPLAAHRRAVAAATVRAAQVIGRGEGRGEAR